MVLKAALIVLLVAIAAGWVAYDQADPAVCLVAMTAAFTAWLTFATLMVLGLVSEAEEEAATADIVPPAGQTPLGWNGTGSPRLVDVRPSGKGFGRFYSPEKEGALRC